MPHKVRAFEKGIWRTSNIFAFIGMGMLLGLMLLDTADVIGRYLFNKPITGTLEISEILMAMTVFLAWPYTQARGSHVSVTVVVARFSPRVQAIIGFFTSFLALVLFVLIAWQGTEMAIEYRHLNRMISTINIPIFPFQMFIPIGALVICLVLITQMLHFFTKMRGVD